MFSIDSLASQLSQLVRHFEHDALKLVDLVRVHPVRVWDGPLVIQLPVRVRYPITAMLLYEHVAQKTHRFARPNGARREALGMLLVV